jgi:type I restriction-modification system DNA methylase subunit
LASNLNGVNETGIYMLDSAINSDDGKKIEETLWQSCDKLRGSIEPAEYKHVVLGLIFLKCLT